MCAIRSVLFLLCLLWQSFGWAHDSRSEMPLLFDKSWIGLSAGISSTDFTSEDFQSGFDFNNKNDTIGALRLQVGHYFNPFLAVSLSLMRGVHSNKFSNDVANTANTTNATYSVSESLLGLTLLPIWPLQDDTMSLYGEGGIGLISRNGFDVAGLTVVEDADIVTGIIGGGFLYQLPYQLFLNVEAIYALPVDTKQQPGIFYAGIGLNYLLVDIADRRVQKDVQYYNFPLQSFEINYVNQDWVYVDAAPFFTPPSIPIFFDGNIKIGEGLLMAYQRNYFHTMKHFSLDWGVSLGQWQTRDLGQNFYTISLFPEMKVWMLRSDECDIYFTYSVAGPSYISERYIDHQDSGSHFTFQDFLGFGVLLGEDKRLTLSLKIVHYSNGNLLPANPGVDVPVMGGIGFTF